MRGRRVGHGEKSGDPWCHIEKMGRERVVTRRLRKHGHLIWNYSIIWPKIGGAPYFGPDNTIIPNPITQSNGISSMVAVYAIV